MMANPDDVTVRVEVVVSGARRTRTIRHRMVPYKINNPLPGPHPTSVRQSGGINYISADGEKLSPSGGIAARVVWAKVYPRTDLILTEDAYKRPDVDSLSVTPANDGSWFFNASNGKELPGAVCTMDPCASGANNTLVVWYDFSDEDEYIQESVLFLAFCPGVAAGSGCGSGFGVGSVLVFGQSLSTTLYATFTGALATLGTVPLSWDGSVWKGAFKPGGGGQLTFAVGPNGFALHSLGFGRSGIGMALGHCTGPFGVTVLE
jgi:hypothetical protein